MCGICGYVSRKIISRQQLELMNNSMEHRGPDDMGAEIYSGTDGYFTGMAQRRLSILDLSSMGHQPMHTDDGRYSIVYNGEIYNYRELRDELRGGYVFHSNCDTEVILAAFAKWGIDCVSRFNGMFAFALYDRDTQEMWLVRDRMGQKPLYFWLDSGNLVFASELKPIMLCPGFEKRINRQILPQYLLHQYIHAPSTVFQNVYQLEPGSWLCFHNGDFKKQHYWSVADRYHALSADPVEDFEEAERLLKERLTDAVSRRLIADVPLGTFLSGGYDSSLVTALAQRLTDKPVRTFSVGFADQEYDESGYARRIAEYLGTDHTQLIITEQEMLDLVESIPQYFDEPMADSSEIPTMLVSKLARSKVTVALSGDAGDELFCGYNIYDLVRKAQKLDGLGSLAHALGRIGGLESHYPFPVRVISRNRDRRTKTQLGSYHYMEAAARMCADPLALPAAYPVEEKYDVSDWQVRRMLLDMDTYLPDDILTKVDRASMKYSLECRCPLLDKEVVELSFRIPQHMKYHKGEKKYILKQIAYDYIPKELLDRPKKGFSVPLDKWMHGPLRSQLSAYADADYLRRQGIFDAAYTSRFVQDYLASEDAGPSTGRNYSGLCWSFFVFQQWYEHYCSGGNGR